MAILAQKVKELLSKSETENLVEAVEKALGDVDIVVSNDGTYLPVSKHNSEVQSLKDQNTDYQNRLTAVNEELSKVKDEVKDNSNLVNQINELQQENENLKTESEKKLSDFKFNSDLKDKLKESYNGKNIKSILPHLDIDKIKEGGDDELKNQVEKLRTDDSTSFLFGEVVAGGVTPPTNTNSDGDGTPSISEDRKKYNIIMAKDNPTEQELLLAGELAEKIKKENNQ